MSLKQWLDAIRNIEIAISGDGLKEPSVSEKKNIHIARKSIHLNKDMLEGTIIRESDMIPLRPGDGISPMNGIQLLVKRYKRSK